MSKKIGHLVYIANINAVGEFKDDVGRTVKRTEMRPFGFTESNIGVGPELMCSALIFSDGCPFTDLESKVVLTVRGVQHLVWTTRSLS